MMPEYPAAIKLQQRQAHGGCAEHKIGDVQRKKAHAAAAPVQDDAAADFEKRGEIADRVVTGARHKEAGQRWQERVTAEEQHYAGSPPYDQQRSRQVNSQQKGPVNFGLPGENGR